MKFSIKYLKNIHYRWRTSKLVDQMIARYSKEDALEIKNTFKEHDRLFNILIGYGFQAKAAILKISDGNMETFREEMVIARQDPRDVVIDAGLAIDKWEDVIINYLKTR